MLNELKISENINARFCHDIAGPLGAIQNGLDFITHSDESMQETAKQLVAVSASQAIARLQFFRQAYGTVSDFGAVNLEQIRTLTDNFFKDTKFTLVWFTDDLYKSFEMPYRFNKLIMNIIIIICDSMIYGGNLTFQLEKNNILNISGHSKKIIFDDQYKNILTYGIKDDIEITSRNVIYIYIYMLIKLLNLELKIDAKEDIIIFKLRGL